MTVFITIKPNRTPSIVLSSIYSNPWVMEDVVKFFISYKYNSSVNNSQIIMCILQPSDNQMVINKV